MSNISSCNILIKISWPIGFVRRTTSHCMSNCSEDGKSIFFKVPGSCNLTHNFLLKIFWPIAFIRNILSVGPVSLWKSFVEEKWTLLEVAHGSTATWLGSAGGSWSAKPHAVKAEDRWQSSRRIDIGCLSVLLLVSRVSQTLWIGNPYWCAFSVISKDL